MLFSLSILTLLLARSHRPVSMDRWVISLKHPTPFRAGWSHAGAARTRLTGGFLVYSVVVMLALTGAPEVSGCHWGCGYSPCCYAPPVSYCYQPVFYYYPPVSYCCEQIATCQPVVTESAKEKEDEKEEMDEAGDG